MAERTRAVVNPVFHGRSVQNRGRDSPAPAAHDTEPWTERTALGRVLVALHEAWGDGIEQRAERRWQAPEPRGDPWIPWQGWLCLLGLVLGAWLASGL